MIDLKNVERSYKTGHAETWVLRRIKLTIREGEFVTIMGPSGAGKSSLLKILMGLLPISAGSGQVVGHELFRDHQAGLARKFRQFAQELVAINSGLRRSIGYMPEADALISPPYRKGWEI